MPAGDCFHKKPLPNFFLPAALVVFKTHGNPPPAGVMAPVLSPSRASPECLLFATVVNAQVLHCTTHGLPGVRREIRSTPLGFPKAL